MVSTFEGVGSAADWHEIKAATGCFFIPSFSSVGAENALNTGVVDGLFSWAAWPHGNTRKLDEGLDASYRHFLGPHRPYMVAVSPWFYTNLPTWNKNWAWKGDDLWNDRWNEILAMRPEYVQIVSETLVSFFCLFFALRYTSQDVSCRHLFCSIPSVY